MSEGASKKSIRLYAVAFAFTLGAGGTLLVSALTKSLSSGLSLMSIAFSIVAVALGALAFRG